MVARLEMGNILRTESVRETAVSRREMIKLWHWEWGREDRKGSRHVENIESTVRMQESEKLDDLGEVTKTRFTGGEVRMGARTEHHRGHTECEVPLGH